MPLRLQSRVGASKAWRGTLDRAGGAWAVRRRNEERVVNATHIGQLGVVTETTTLVPWSKLAEAVATADSRGQAEFFEHLAILLAGEQYGPGKWAMQCRSIAEEPGWLPLNRQRIAGQLETRAHYIADCLPHHTT